MTHEASSDMTHERSSARVAASKPKIAREFVLANGYPADSLRPTDMLTWDTNKNKITLMDVLVANPNLCAVDRWFSCDTEDMVMDSDALCRTGTQVMVSYAALGEHEVWVGMTGVLIKKMCIGQWLVRFPCGSLDRLVSHAVLKCGRFGKFEMVYAQNRAARLLKEQKKLSAEVQKQRIQDMQGKGGGGKWKGDIPETPDERRRGVSRSGGELAPSDASSLNLLNELVQVVYGIEATDWRQVERPASASLRARVRMSLNRQ